MGILNGARARVIDVRDVGRDATIISYPSFGSGDFAVVHFDGDPEPVTVHKSRVNKILRMAKEGEA